MRLKYLFWATIFLMLLAGPASGEIYQYTDDSGVVRFTDDPSLIPDDQRSNVQTMESVKRENVSQVSSAASNLGVDETPAGKLRGRAHELDVLGEELTNEYKALQEEREALGDRPSHTAKTVERNAYNEKVKELNRKIDLYEQHKKEYQEKVEAFNSQISAK